MKILRIPNSIKQQLSKHNKETGVKKYVQPFLEVSITPTDKSLGFKAIPTVRFASGHISKGQFDSTTFPVQLMVWEVGV